MPEGVTQSAAVPDESIELQPFFHNAKQNLINPKQVVVGSRYFWEKWAPLLGPTLTVLIVRLRMHCYYNRVTQERRDWCYPTQQTLAQEIGVSRWTVMRELKKPLAREFVRIQYRSRYDRDRRQTVRISSLYHVAMDDPLVAEDRRRLTLVGSGSAFPETQRQVADSSLTVCPSTEEAERDRLTGSIAPTGQVQTATGPSRSKSLPKEEPEPDTHFSDVDVIARELMDEEISAEAAARLARDFPAEVIRDKVAQVRQLASERGSIRNTAGFLRRAIERDYRLQATGTDGLQPRSLLQLRPAATSGAAGCEPANRLFTSSPAAGGEDSIRSAGRTAGIDVWERAKASLRAEMTAAAYDQWLQFSRLLSYAPGLVTVAAPDRQVQGYIQRRLGRAAEAALETSCGERVRLEVVVDAAAVTQQSAY